MSEHTVIVNGIATSYSQSGKGPDALLLHGWGDSRRTFTDIVKLLEPSYRVTAIDLPGFGGTELPDKPWDLTNYGNFVAIFCQKIGVKPNLVVGHSNGGALAIHAIATNIFTSEKLILLAPSGVRDPNNVKLLATKAIAKTSKLATLWLPKKVQSKFRAKFYRKIGSDMLVKPQLQETFKMIVKQDVQEDATHLRAKTLLICGGKDKATPVLDVGERLAGLIVDAKLYVIPEAGHFVHHDAPAEVENYIREFLAK